MIIALLWLLACGGTEMTDSDTDTVDTDVEDTDVDTNVCEEADTAVSGAECAFNADCPCDERCGCSEKTGCFCETGPRGTGVNGVDTCTDGNDCASALCVEGQDDAYYCSDACETNANCGAALPNCTDVAFVGRICIREAPNQR